MRLLFDGTELGLKFRQDKKKQLLDLIQRTKEKKTISLGQALRMVLGKERVPEGFQIIGLESSGILQSLLDRLLGKWNLEKIDQPTAFQGTLRPYQLTGLSWLTFLNNFYLGACLADDMGLGKTIQIIAWILHVKETLKILSPNASSSESNLTETPQIKSHLIICPLSLIGNWQHELHQFAPTLKIFIYHGNKRCSADALKQELQNIDVCITSYSIVFRDIISLQQIEWFSIILDEAQKIKNWRTKQTQAINQLNGIHRIALTGTPIENRLGELWSIMEFLNPGYLGSQKDFHLQFERPILGHDASATKLLKQLIQPFVLRRLKQIN